MKVMIFGATGMVGQGVLQECLKDPEVTAVLSVARSASGIRHPKLRDLVRGDLYDYSGLDAELSGYDACFFCLGVSSAGMSEADYHRISYDLTLAAAKTLARLNPAMTFIYVSGTGTDSTEKGSSMWARVKGKTENALLKLPFKAAYMFRPGFIQPMDGIKSKTKLYRAIYAVLGPFYPLMKRAFPKVVTNTQQVGRAMIRAAKSGAPKTLLENRDINELAAQ
jgi:uncharacterized protein YbjT (DUF2867 family)